MTKKSVLAVIAFIGVSVTACNSSNVVETASTIDTTSAIEATSASEISVRSASAENHEITSEIPDTKGLSLELATVMYDLGIYKVPNNTNFIIREESDYEIHVEITMTTEICNLRFYCIYVKPTSHWLFYLVENDENQHVYWVADDQKPYVDFYDYSTDELISSQSEPFDFDKSMDDYNKALESMNESADAALDSIADKYNIERPSN